jgi:S-adenosylmethionine synthetase
MRIEVSPLIEPPVAAAPVEIVERKGLGHPDTLCDALADQFSLTLSRFYRERFGFVLHHNVDKGLLWGGAARPAFGAGEILEPIEIFLCGRATREYRGVRVPVEELAIEGARAWLRENLHALDVERHVRVRCLIRPSSADLVELFARSQRGGVALANDTSCGVGFAPYDELERAVLAVERTLNERVLKTRHPEIGEDIKVMGVRRDGTTMLTVACALVGRHVHDMDDYLAKKARVGELARAAARHAGAAEVSVAVNSADGDTPDSVYLTVSGTSAEGGDDGEVGRGNRANGLITPYRPMTMEAAAGKNPITHVGKLYNVVAGRIAQALVQELDGVVEAYCYLVSRIGHRIDEPQAADVKLRLAPGGQLPALTARAQELVRARLRALPQLWRELLDSPQPPY